MGFVRRRADAPTLARISHQDATAATHLRALARDLSLRGLDVASATPPLPSVEISCQHTHLRRLATRPGEKSGLGPSHPADRRETATR